jgi:hypothetical protein
VTMCAMGPGVGVATTCVCICDRLRLLVVWKYRLYGKEVGGRG